MLTPNTIALCCTVPPIHLPSTNRESLVDHWLGVTPASPGQVPELLLQVTPGRPADLAGTHGLGTMPNPITELYDDAGIGRPAEASAKGDLVVKMLSPQIDSTAGSDQVRCLAAVALLRLPCCVLTAASLCRSTAGALLRLHCVALCQRRRGGPSPTRACVPRAASVAPSSPTPCITLQPSGRTARCSTWVVQAHTPTSRCAPCSVAMRPGTSGQRTCRYVASLLPCAATFAAAVMHCTGCIA